MPDLFHFMQDISRTVGAKLGLQLSRIYKKLSKTDLSPAQKESLEAEKEEIEAYLATYQSHRQALNYQVHPFDEQDKLVNPEEVENSLKQLFTKIRSIAGQADIDISIEQGNKIIKQIPDIAKGIGAWQNWLEEEIASFSLGKEVRKWLLGILLPHAYWQIHLTKVSTRKRDKALRIYYKNRAQTAKQRFEQSTLNLQLTEAEKEVYVNWAFQMTATFHRSSSQVEGRNGYLSFMHHARKGIAEQRQEVLTVVHNFDIRRADGKTPAQRLFKMNFPVLFDFILENVTDFPSPRTRKFKTL